MDIKGLIGDLKEAGIIGIHMTTEAFFNNFDDSYVVPNNDERYFWKAVSIYNGLTFYTFLGLEEMAEFNIDVFKTQ